MPRLKNIIKKVGSTSLIAVYYAPVVLYVYAYVIIDGICNKNVNECAK